MKPTNQLTELSIKQAKPKEKQYKLTDGEGMYLRVYPNGSKYWQLQYWFDGKQKILSIGVWPDISLKDARDKRYEAKKKIKEGTNPLDEKKEILKSLDFIQEKEKLRESTTFQKVAEEWISRKSIEWTERHSRGVKSSLSMHAYPDLGEKPISTISKQDIISTLRKLEAEGKYEACYRLRQKIEAIFSYAEIEGQCIGNPAKGLQQILTKPQPKSQNSLPISELPEFLEKMDADKVTAPTTLLAMKFIILTFVRTSELRFADWTEFDIDCTEPLWVIPADRMKMRRTHHVPLSRQAVGLLKDLRSMSGHGELLFTGRNNPARPISENTMNKAIAKMGYKGLHCSHGSRTVFSTISNESELWSEDAIELQLDHKLKDKIRAAYSRGLYLNQRRKLMQWYADYLDELKLKGK